MQFTQTSAKTGHFLPLSMQDGGQGSLFSLDELFPSGTTADSRKNLEAL